MIEIDPHGAASCANTVFREGWDPLVCISMEHGIGYYSHHLYASRCTGGDEEFGCFEYFDDHARKRDYFTYFDSGERANEDYQIITDIAVLAHIKHQRVDLSDFPDPQPSGETHTVQI